MPKQLSDKDRILAFAFRAGVPELEEAAAVINAALRAKKGAGRADKPARTSKPRGLPGAKNANASDTPDAA